MQSFDITWARTQFPALAQQSKGRANIFFDGPGGTQTPQQVIDAISKYLIYANANTHGAFSRSIQTDETIVAARTAMSQFLGCDKDEIVFGSNMTSLTFALSRAIGRHLNPRDEIIVTKLDHDANFSPWLALEERGVVVRVVDINVEDCTLDMTSLVEQINENTKLVAVGYASNAVGTINDVAEIARLAHNVGALVFVDAVHYAPHGPIDVQAINCDFLVCSPYKFFGPHIGVLYAKREHLGRFRPYKVRPASDNIPDCWETGTQNHEAMAGTIAAVNYIAELGRRIAPDTLGYRKQILTAMKAICSYEKQLCEQLVTGLLKIPNLTFYGIRALENFDWRTPTIGIRLAGYTPGELAQILSERGISTWDGNHYAINLTERLGIETSGGLLRIGLVHYNTSEEIEFLLEQLNQISAAKSVPALASR
ncbi:MAG: cysteine desulfurase-like protein [Nostoc sp. ChiSLP02]|nr:cysteine desulfurase-like protein [Nostoc sp. DedSLP05]MDZ8101825.1 cysteine desulfurase-like protein [Nostoc sp. DedSLP01]MDZ8186232.1 cysteine desulfurase-like protein [Nostoc sp. ChiSLP02]